MNELGFTSRVLGPDATQLLARKGVTQTLRSQHTDIAFLIQRGLFQATAGIDVRLDGRKIGQATVTELDHVSFSQLNQDDVRRGGFGSLDELKAALIRAGYRYKPMNEYLFHRIQFSWKE